MGGATAAAELFGELSLDFYVATNAKVTIKYNGTIGSSGGIDDTATAKLSLAMSDAPLTDAEKSEIEHTAPQAPIMQLPFYAGGVAIIHSLPGGVVPEGQTLRLTADLLARIFRGAVRVWNHADLVEINPFLAAVGPVPIHPYARSDASGTSWDLSAYLLAAAGPAAWPSGRSKFPTFPQYVTKVTGTQGILDAVKRRQGSIGYVSFSYAKRAGLQIASIQNGDQFVTPSVSSLANAAAEGLQNLPPSVLSSWQNVNITNQPGDNVYPISSVHYALVYQDQSFTGLEGAATGAFLQYVLTERAQSFLAGQYFARLPASALALNKFGIDHIQYDSDIVPALFWPLPPNTPHMQPLSPPGTPQMPPRTRIDFSVPPKAPPPLFDSQALSSMDILMTLLFVGGFLLVLLIDQWRNGWFCAPERRGLCSLPENETKKDDDEEDNL